MNFLCLLSILITMSVTPLAIGGFAGQMEPLSSGMLHDEWLLREIETGVQAAAALRLRGRCNKLCHHGFQHHESGDFPVSR